MKMKENGANENRKQRLKSGGVIGVISVASAWRRQWQMAAKMKMAA
jgi:hypothetical protein